MVCVVSHHSRAENSSELGREDLRHYISQMENLSPEQVHVQTTDSREIARISLNSHKSALFTTDVQQRPCRLL